MSDLVLLTPDVGDLKDRSTVLLDGTDHEPRELPGGLVEHLDPAHVDPAIPHFVGFLNVLHRDVGFKAVGLVFVGVLGEFELLRLGVSWGVVVSSIGLLRGLAPG